jgi:type VI secretion system secreted protein Hcp
MAVDAFLKLTDIKGESVVKGHEEEIDILSWSWSMSQQGTAHTGSGGGAGKVQVSDLVISKMTDAASPNVVKAICTGKHISEAVLTLRKAGETPLDYMVITLTDVLITSYSVGGGGDIPTESIGLTFASFKESYQPQDKTGGKKGGAIDVEYNIAENA